MAGLDDITTARKFIQTTNNIYRYQVYNKGSPPGSPGHFNTHYNFVSIPDNSFGHWTNNKVSYTRYYDGSAESGAINDPVHEMVVLSLFFSLYDKQYDYPGGRVPRSHPNTDLGSFNIQGDDIGNYAGTFTTAVGLDLLLASELKQINVNYSNQRLERIRGNFSKYLCAQLYYSFMNQYYDTRNTRGIRIYFDSYSMNLFKTCNLDLILHLPWEYILQHIDAEDNEIIHKRWDEIDGKFKDYFNNEIINKKISLKTTQLPLNARSINYTIYGLPASIYVNNYDICIHSICSPEERHILLIRIYMFFSCCSSKERWDIRNRVFQYFEYQLDASLLTNYRIMVNNKPIEFVYAKTQGYIGQYIRYLALGQSSVTGGLPRPKVIYIRDAHHAIPTRRELAVMAAFKGMPTKRYFWGLGPIYVAGWHQPPLEAFDMSVAGIGQSSGSPVNMLRSCWAGLQSFKQLNDTNACVFAGNRLDFIRTIGLLLLVDVGNPDHVTMCDYIFGLRYNKRTDVATYYLYGIDERMLTNCFYSVVEIDVDPQGQYNLRVSTDEEKRNSLMWQNAIVTLPDNKTLGGFKRTKGTWSLGENWRKKLMVNSIFYTFTLDSENIHAINNKFDLGEPNPVKVASGFNPSSIMNEAIGEYIRNTGSYPKSAGDFLRFVEGEKDHNLKEPLQISNYSLYHSASLLFSSFNLIENPSVRLRPWFNKTFIAENNPANIIYKERSKANMIVLFKTAVTKKNNAFHEEINFIHNISHHNKRSVLPETLPDDDNMNNWMRPRNPDNRLMCYGDIRDSSNLDGTLLPRPWNGISDSSCLTHPLDLPTEIVPRVATTGISNIRRGGLSFNPDTEIRSIEGVGGRTNPYQMGGTKNNQSTLKKLNATVNTVANSKMISNKDDYENFTWALRNNGQISFKDIDEKSRASINKILKDAMSSDIFNKIAAHWVDTHPGLKIIEEYAPAYDIYNPDAEILKSIGNFSGQFKTYITHINSNDEKSFFDIFFKGISKPIPSLDSILMSSLDNFFSDYRKKSYKPIMNTYNSKNRITSEKIENKPNSNNKGNTMNIYNKGTLRKNKNNMKKTRRKTNKISNKKFTRKLNQPLDLVS